MPFMRKMEIKGKESRKRRGINVRNEIEIKKNIYFWKILMKLGNNILGNNLFITFKRDVASW